MKIPINFFLLAVYLLIPSAECAHLLDRPRSEPKTVEGPVFARYNGTLTCAFPPFCAMIYYMEHDSRLAKDVFAYVPLNCSNTEELFHTIGFNMTSESSLDHVYKPIWNIYHDCGGKFVEEKAMLRNIKGDTLRFFHAYGHSLRSSGPEAEVKTIVEENSIFRADMFKNKEYKEKVTDWIANKSVCIQHETVQIHYKGTLICATGERFCARILYKEEDLLWDDDLAFVPLQCTEERELHHEIIIDITGGDGINDIVHETRISVFHDCGGEVMCAKLPLLNVSMCNSSVSFAYTRDITKLGWKASSSLLDENSGQ